MFRGLQFCAQWEIPKLTESDHLLLVNELHLSQEDFSTLGHLLKEIQQMLKSFQECKVLHVHRMENEVAYRLGRYA